MDTGVSPVIGIVLMVAVSVSLVVGVGVFVFDLFEQPSEPAEASYQIESVAGENAVRIKVVRNDNVEEFKLSGSAMSTSYTFTGKTFVEKVAVVSDGRVVLTAVLSSGDEQILQTKEVSFILSGTNNPRTTEPDCSGVNFNTAADGTRLIRNDSQLQCINQDLDADYRLVRSVDISGSDQWNGGNGFKPIGSNGNEFTGSFDGDGYSIQGLSIQRSSTQYVGLFGKTQDATVQSVTMSSVDVAGDAKVGAIAGEMVSGSATGISVSGTVTGENGATGGVVARSTATIDNVEASGTVSGNNDNVGGIVGVNDGVIQHSSAESDVSSNDENAGVVVGLNKGLVENAYANGTVQVNDEDAGGLVGENDDGTVRRSYSASTIQTGSDAGGLIGESDGTVEKSYWMDVSTSDVATTETGSSGDVNGVKTASAGGDDYTLDELQGDSAASNMVFDFSSIWQTVDGEFPDLR